jgi:hypothetical protein
VADLTLVRSANTVNYDENVAPLHSQRVSHCRYTFDVNFLFRHRPLLRRHYKCKRWRILWEVGDSTFEVTIQVVQALGDCNHGALGQCVRFIWIEALVGPRVESFAHWKHMEKPSLVI